MAISANKLGRYELRREIARSNDVVYEAWDPALNRRVAVKEMVMPPGVTGAAAKERIQRFYREARAAGALSHPNIVTVYEVGEDVGRHFIAMEFLEGPTLREALQGGQAFAVDRAVLIASQVADALAYAHEHGVIHRDVKPDNVHLVAPTMPKLTDFGIARIQTETNITLSGQVFGTPSYMSPEQVAGGDIDARTDLFSLGVMLFEMVAGRKPFVGESVVTITYNIVHETPVIPANVPEWLAAILRKALHKNPADRYAGAADMAEDLRNHRAPRGMGYAPGQLSGVAPNAWGAPKGAGPGTGYGQPAYGPSPYGPPPGGPDPLIFQAARPPLRLPKLPKLPKLSDEAKTFATALLVTLLVSVLIVWGVWASSVVFHQQRRAQAAMATQNQRQQAQALLTHGNYAAALRMLEAVYRQTGSEADLGRLADAHVEYGLKLYGSDQLNQYLAAEQLEPNEAVPKVLIANTYYLMGNYTQSLAYCDAAADRLSSSTLWTVTPQIRNALAQMYLALGDQARQSGAINGQEHRDLWAKAKQTDPFGTIGQQADSRLQSPY